MIVLHPCLVGREWLIDGVGVGSCTTAIINLHEIPAQYIPRTTIALPLSDVTKFRAVSHAHAEIATTCCSINRMMGWIVFGKFSRMETLTGNNFPKARTP